MDYELVDNGEDISAANNDDNNTSTMIEHDTSTTEHDTSGVDNGNDIENNTNKSPQGPPNVETDKSQVRTKINLPLSKVRSIIKSDPDVSLAGNETVYLMTKMTELFIGHIANRAYHYTKIGKRKTIQEKDVMACVNSNDELSFLEGIIESLDS